MMGARRQIAVGTVEMDATYEAGLLKFRDTLVNSRWRRIAWRVRFVRVSGEGCVAAFFATGLAGRELVGICLPMSLEPMTNELARRYARATSAIGTALHPDTPFEERMQIIVDALWEEFGEHRPVSWVGFYLLGDGEMTLGPRRDKPACSPIGLHGACGSAALSGKTVVVRDVRELGANYIACDPRDLSEIVVPVRARDGRVTGVLDIDSYSVEAFGETDRIALEQLVAEHLAEGV
jgi:putative methionine-R-sulfoxide reductase with GAF domain